MRYRFEAVVEPDDDQWHAYCPALVEHGGATWGETREDALANLEEVVRLVVASLIEHGDDVPAGAVDHAGQGEPLIAVNLRLPQHRLDDRCRSIIGGSAD